MLFSLTIILFRRLEIDPELRDTTHIVVDEVHERSEESDFLLMILRDTLRKVGLSINLYIIRDTTHIVVDKVHERSEESDFLLMNLRDTLRKVGLSIYG